MNGEKGKDKGEGEGEGAGEGLIRRKRGRTDTAKGLGEAWKGKKGNGVND